jgi:hypothetical protein
MYIEIERVYPYLIIIIIIMQRKKQGDDRHKPQSCTLEKDLENKVRVIAAQQRRKRWKNM